ncbi:hypothetical protein MasN3_41330 [Massilia varians]|uniref:Uncharacterized protein n=1 Tax=Massilia varians TaxID=457921 RepID=A0ABN6TEI2_9BURK|nr:hypothetical protein MasN3_41330 [Massilia varians]
MPLLFAFPALAQTKAENDAAKAALELEIARATSKALIAQREAEARRELAEAELAELQARLPPAASKPLEGKVDVSRFGAAGLVKAFDLARELAPGVCNALPPGRKAVIHDPVSTQGVVTARIVSDGIAHMNRQLEQQALALQGVIERYRPASAGSTTLSPLGMAVVPAMVRSFADLASLFKTDVTVQGIACGNGTRELFATALAQTCPGKLSGLGSGYLGELAPAQHANLLAQVRAIVLLRGQNAGRIAVIERLADAAKGETKKELDRMADDAMELLEAVDAFVESLKVGETGDKSPLYNAARYLGYAERLRDALVLDFDLRLEGMSIVKDSLFTGQRLRLSGVAFLWYRLHEPDGRLLAAEVLRQISRRWRWICVARVRRIHSGQANNRISYLWTPPDLQEED